MMKMSVSGEEDDDIGDVVQRMMFTLLATKKC